MFNASIYPRDKRALAAINCKIPLKPHTKDEEYLNLLRTNLKESLDSFSPQFVIFNAGTDCLIGDPLGQLDITADGIAERDAIVFGECFERKIPLVMLLSGGYQKSNAKVIADSIENLNKKFKLWEK